MAVGDIVSEFSGDNAELDFQPAAGVDVLITSVAASSSAANITDGTDFAEIMNTDGNAGTTQNMLKVFINNTNRIQVGAQGAGVHSALSGIVVG